MAGARSAGRLMLGRLRPETRARVWDVVGEDWFETLGDMKGAAMKLGQLASQYGDLLPPGLAQAMARLQRDAVPRPFSEMSAVLSTEWTAEQRAQIADIDPQPLACASIGQVHAARHRDGRALVIKIRYPGVAEAVDDDVRALGRLLKMGKLLDIDGAALDAVLKEVRDRFREETNYCQELAHLQGLSSAAPHPSIRYPQAEPALCTSAVLVTGALPADDLETARSYSQAARNKIGTTLLEWSLHQVLTAGVMHADPHPGNFGFHPDGTVTVYDYGCVKVMAPEMPSLLRRLLAAGVARDFAALHVGMAELGSLSRNDPPSAATLAPLYAEFHDVLLGRLLSAPVFDFADGSLIDDARTVARDRFREAMRAFRPVPELAFVARALSGHYWLLRGLAARVEVAACVARAMDGARFDQPRDDGVEKSESWARSIVESERR